MVRYFASFISPEGLLSQEADAIIGIEPTQST